MVGEFGVRGLPRAAQKRRSGPTVWRPRDQPGPLEEAAERLSDPNKPPRERASFRFARYLTGTLDDAAFLAVMSLRLRACLLELREPPLWLRILKLFRRTDERPRLSGQALVRLYRLAGQSPPPDVKTYRRYRLNPDVFAALIEAAEERRKEPDGTAPQGS